MSRVVPSPGDAHCVVPPRDRHEAGGGAAGETRRRKLCMGGGAGTVCVTVSALSAGCGPPSRS